MKDPTRNIVVTKPELDPHPNKETNRSINFVLELETLGTREHVLKMKERIERFLQVSLHDDDLELILDYYQYKQ